MPPAVLRPADPARDAAACRRIYAPAVSGPASFEEQVPDEAEMARRIADAHRFLVAEVDGEVAGYASASAHRARAGYRWTVEVSAYVAPAHQRRGLAGALYAELLAELRARGFRLALACITLPNPASAALHEAVGFTPVGTFPAVGFTAGAWRDTGWWQLDLGAPAALPPPRADAPLTSGAPLA